MIYNFRCLTILDLATLKRNLLWPFGFRNQEEHKIRLISQLWDSQNVSWTTLKVQSNQVKKQLISNFCPHRWMMFSRILFLTTILNGKIINLWETFKFNQEWVILWSKTYFSLRQFLIQCWLVLVLISFFFLQLISWLDVICYFPLEYSAEEQKKVLLNWSAFNCFNFYDIYSYV